MSAVLENIKKRASLKNKNIVLPEGEEERIIRAAASHPRPTPPSIPSLPTP